MDKNLDLHKEKIKHFIDLMRFEGYTTADIVQMLVEVLNENKWTIRENDTFKQYCEARKEQAIEFFKKTYPDGKIRKIEGYHQHDL